MAKHNSNPVEEAALQGRLGAAIRECRRKLGITQEELAWRASMHRTYIADIERGGRNITLRSVAGIAQALDLTMWDLLARACLVDSAATGPSQGPLGEILVVEDDVNDIELTLHAFERAKFTNPIHVAKDGVEALDYLFRQGSYADKPGTRSPQLVLLDLNLPRLSGIEVLRQMKANKQTKSIPVIVLTGSQSEPNIAECRKLGAAAYIVKPVGFENFSQVTSELSFNWALLKPSAVSATGAPRTNAA